MKYVSKEQAIEKRDQLAAKFRQIRAEYESEEEYLNDPRIDSMVDEVCYYIEVIEYEEQLENL